MFSDSGCNYDGSGSSNGPVAFSDAGPAILWMLITFGVGMLMLGAVGAGIWLTTSNPAALGLTVPLAMCAAFIVPACFADCLRTAREFKRHKR